VFILNGKYIGAISFLPEPGDFRTNFGYVPSYAPTTLSLKEEEACCEVGEYLVTQKVSLAALDFIDNFLIEINITCPGGIPEWNKQYGRKLEAIIVDGLTNAQT
jgi:glutathione synthase